MENSKHSSKSQKIYAPMSHISSNAESPRRNYGYILPLTNSILDSGETCHITPEIYDFIPGLLVETDKYIECSDGHFVTAKQTRQVQIEIGDDNGKPFIAMLFNVILAIDLCDRLSFIIASMNLGHT